MTTLNIDTPFTKEQIEQLFDRFDYNGNKLLSLAEIDKAVLELWPEMGKHKPALIRAYRAAEFSETGFVNLEEFTDLLYFLAYYDNLYEKFASMDENKDHRIDFKEFEEGLSIIGLSTESIHLQQEFSAMDHNNGGMILFDEFCMYMAKRFGTNSDRRTQRAAENSSTVPITGKKNLHTKTVKERRPDIDIKEFLKVDQTWTNEQVHDLFLRFDATNNNGLLSLAEIDKAVQDIWPEMSKHKNALMRAYKASDKSADGFVNEAEFGDLLYFLALYDKLAIFFDKIDKDRNHKLDFNEFKDSHDILGLKGLNQAHLEAEFQSMDHDGGGTILFDEFCVYLIKAYGSNSDKRNEVASKNFVSVQSTQHSAASKISHTKVKSITKVNESSTEISTSTVWTEDQIHELFQKFDSNNNGILSLSEIEKGIQILWPNMSKHKGVMLRAYKSCDYSGDGFVSEEEFKTLLYFLAFYEKLYAQFSASDINGDQRLGLDEFISSCSSLGLGNKSRDDLDLEFQKIDANGGGYILFDEFCAYLALNSVNSNVPVPASNSFNLNSIASDSWKKLNPKNSKLPEGNRLLLQKKANVTTGRETTSFQKPSSQDNKSLNDNKTNLPTRPVTDAKYSVPYSAPSQPYSATSNLNSLERKLNHELAERKRLEHVIESLKHQLEPYTSNADGLSKNYLAAMDQLSEKNYKLQQKLDSEISKNAGLSIQLMELSEKIRLLEVKGKKEYFETSKQAKDQQVNLLTKEVRELRADKIKWERMYEEMSKKKALEEERNKKLEEEVAQWRMSDRKAAKNKF